MVDRKIRTVMAFAFFAGTFITGVTLLLYLYKWPTWALVLIFIGYTIVQVSLAPVLYKSIYESKWIDLPRWLRKYYPPLGYRFTQDNQGDRVSYDVILLRPSSQVLSAPDCGEAMGLGYLASVLRNRGLNTLVIDSRLLGIDTMQTVELLMMYQAPMLGVNLNFQYLAPTTAQLIKALRERGYKSHITLGGLYASVAYETIMANMPGVDTIVRFEGEKTYLDLINSIASREEWPGIPGLIYRDTSGEVVSNKLRPLISDLNTIPDPARDFLPVASRLGGYAYVVSSRGCNGACAYCVQQRSVSDPQGRRWRGRDPEEVANELQHLAQDYGIRKFSFVDDDFFGHAIKGKTHGQSVAEAIIARKLNASILLSIQPRDVDYETFALLKRAGVDSVILAADNFSQAVLDRYKKLTTVEQNLRSIEILRSLGIDAYLGIIMFDPWTTLEELVENLTVMRSLPYLRPWQILSKLETYYGSPITVELEKQGMLEWGEYSAKYRYQDVRIQGVFSAMEIEMKILNPSMSQLDGFRWGNLDYSEADEWIIHHLEKDLAQINAKYNLQALEMALEIVKKQIATSDPISPMKLADDRLQREAEILDQLTIREISDLREKALSQKMEAEEAGLSTENINA